MLRVTRHGSLYSLPRTVTTLRGGPLPPGEFRFPQPLTSHGGRPDAGVAAMEAAGRAPVVRASDDAARSAPILTSHDCD